MPVLCRPRRRFVVRSSPPASPLFLLYSVAGAALFLTSGLSHVHGINEEHEHGAEPSGSGTTFRHEMSLDREGKLYLHWNDPARDRVSLMLKYYGRRTGWVGLGLSPAPYRGAEGEGGADALYMVGSEAVIGLPGDDGTAVRKYHLSGKNVDGSGVVPMAESAQTLLDASVQRDATGTVLTFTKILDEGQGEIPILVNGSNTFIYAYGEGDALGYHEDRGVFTLDFAEYSSTTATKTDAEGSGVDDESNGREGGEGTEFSATHSHSHSHSRDGSRRAMFVAHGVLAMLAWSVCAPLAVTAALARSIWPDQWFAIHVGANVACFSLTLIAFSVAVSAVSKTNRPHFSEYHHVIGLVMMIGVSLQLLNGLMRPRIANLAPPDDEADDVSTSSKNRKWAERRRVVWEYLHKGSGASLLVLGVWQVHDGLSMIASSYGIQNLSPIYLAWKAQGFILFSAWFLWRKRRKRYAGVGEEIGGVGAASPEASCSRTKQRTSPLPPPAKESQVNFDYGEEEKEEQWLNPVA